MALPSPSAPLPGGRPEAAPLPSLRARSRWRRFAAVVGPGLVVMLADTDAGSVVTAAQSGAQWGYRLLALQFALIPVLFVVQELTVRLGTTTGKGHGQLIKEHFGLGWAWFSVGTLVLACLGALLSELSGLAGVGQLFGVPVNATMAVVFAGLTLMALTGSYRSVERIAMAFGAFELVFLLVAWQAHPDAAAMLDGALRIPLHDTDYRYMIAANIGAVLMPWMVFFQQSSIVEKGLTRVDLSAARWDTAIGAVATQLIMASVLVATAASLGEGAPAVTLDSVGQIADAFTRVLGPTTGRVLFGLGLAGSALVAAIVVTLTAARSLAEVLGAKHSLEHSPREAPWFYGVYALCLGLGALLVGSGINLVRVSVGVQVMNALLLPIVLAFLYLLARRLPAADRLRGRYAVLVLAIIVLTTALGVFAALSGIFSGGPR
ncbi:Metal ion transporter, metal ion (Mn2+/Fe2+) transporter (Nramp) family [Burkholderiales bacterium]|nr:Metal ion transporter, metal ion (Mn2+/Fe2+) transporter (Nramp) family [Burkholderiales bacterium]